MNIFSILDSPIALNMMFYPRTAPPHTSQVAGALDGTIPVDDAVELGYRFYPHQDQAAPVVLFFHGNGEIAADYEAIAPMFHQIGASLLVVDFRGYGWSTGKPLASALLTDVEAVHRALPDILARAGVSDNPVFVMGRSLGSFSAIHIAHLYPATFKGIIIESGFANFIAWVASKGFPVHLLQNSDPYKNPDKIKALDLPLLVIHGEQDQLLPVSNGQALYDASPAAYRQILRVPGAGHNDLLFRAAHDYFAAIKRLIEAALAEEQ